MFIRELDIVAERDGDPEYYKRFGFVPTETFGIGSADNKYMDGLQALEYCYLSGLSRPRE